MARKSEAALQRRRDYAREYQRRARKDPELRAILNQRANASRMKRYYTDPTWRQEFKAKLEARAQRHTIRINSIKLERGCADCEYDLAAVALDFDHLPGFEKLFTIGNSSRRSWEALEAEIAKCDVVCANCHRIRTQDRRSVKQLTESGNRE